MALNIEKGLEKGVQKIKEVGGSAIDKIRDHVPDTEAMKNHVRKAVSIAVLAGMLTPGSVLGHESGNKKPHSRNTKAVAAQSLDVSQNATNESIEQASSSEEFVTPINETNKEQILESMKTSSNKLPLNVEAIDVNDENNSIKANNFVGVFWAVNQVDLKNKTGIVTEATVGCFNASDPYNPDYNRQNKLYITFGYTDKDGNPVLDSDGKPVQYNTGTQTWEFPEYGTVGFRLAVITEEAKKAQYFLSQTPGYNEASEGEDEAVYATFRVHGTIQYPVKDPFGNVQLKTGPVDREDSMRVVTGRRKLDLASLNEEEGSR